MCVHKKVSALSGMAQNSACRAATESRSCAHHNQVDSFLRYDPDFGQREPVDIETVDRNTCNISIHRMRRPAASSTGGLPNSTRKPRGKYN